MLKSRILASGIQVEHWIHSISKGSSGYPKDVYTYSSDTTVIVQPIPAHELAILTQEVESVGAKWKVFTLPEFDSSAKDLIKYQGIFYEIVREPSIYYMSDRIQMAHKVVYIKRYEGNFSG